MARPAANGYQLVWREGRGWYVRFRLGEERRIISTGYKERREKSRAAQKARELYAAEVTAPVRKPKRGASTDLVDVVAGWLESVSVRDVTKVLYTKYAGYWVERWTTVEQITAPELSLYAGARLKQNTGKTVRNEVSALRRCLIWAKDAGLVAEVPEFPKVDRNGGTPYHRRTRVAAPDLSPEEVWSLIDALPERSNRDGWPIRARVIVSYVTSLRPTTLDKLSVPEHYSPGSKTLRVPADLDKEGFARELPLPAVACKALDSVCPPGGGLIFGAHRLGPYLTEAAKRVLPPQKAAVLIAQHFRSASITHALEKTGSLPGVQYMAGHKHTSTTARYVRPSFRAALDVVVSWDEPRADE